MIKKLICLLTLMTFISSSIHCGIFSCEHNYCSIPANMRFSKWGLPFYIFQIDGDMAKFDQISIYLINKIVLISNIFFNFQDTKKEDHLVKKTRKTYSLIFILSLPFIKYQKSKTTLKSSLNTHVKYF